MTILHVAAGVVLGGFGLFACYAAFEAGCREENDIGRGLRFAGFAAALIVSACLVIARLV